MSAGWVLASGILLGLAAAAFFAASESALFALVGSGEERSGVEPDGRGPGVGRLVARADRLQHAIALGHLLAVVWVSGLAWIAVEQATGGVGAVSWIAVPLATTLVVLVLGELVPKSVGLERPELWIGAAATVLRAWDVLLAPVTVPLRALGGAYDRALGPGAAVDPISADEVRAIVAESSESADLDVDERRMIRSIFAFGDTTVREVMTPRPDIVAIEADTPWPEVLEQVREAEHSRVPVYAGSLDEVVGVLYAKDLLAHAHGLAEPPQDLRGMSWEVSFVPEGKKIDDLLREFQRREIHLAVVVDEYGGTAGIVTLEDILEELVGEIQDEYDHEAPLVEPLAEGALRIDGRLDADDFNELTGADLEGEEVETIGGLVARELGRVATGGETVDVGDWRFTVESVDGKRIVKLRVAPIATAGGGQETGSDAGEDA